MTAFDADVWLPQMYVLFTRQISWQNVRVLKPFTYKPRRESVLGCLSKVSTQPTGYSSVLLSIHIFNISLYDIH